MGMMTFLAHEHILNATEMVSFLAHENATENLRHTTRPNTKELKFSLLQHCTESLA